MKPICFYHSADLDGVCSGAIVKHFVPDVELVGFDYGQEFPWEKATAFDADWSRDPSTPIPKRTVYMVDVSLPPADMKRLAEVSNLIWIDHHKTAIDAAIQDGYSTSRGACAGIQTSAYAACELCWKWFTVVYESGPELSPVNYAQKLMGAPTPEAVRLLGRYDVGAKDDPEWESKIMPFQYGMRTLPGVYSPDSAVWGSLFCSGGQVRFDTTKDVWYGIDEIIEQGNAILRYQAEVNRHACKMGAREELLILGPIPDARSHIRILACNTIVFNSQFFDGFYDPEKHDVMCAYGRLANGKWKVSLYSTKPEIDCGAICKTFGGGGHKGAAGFICDKLPWEN